MGTPDSTSLKQLSLSALVENRQGLRIACPEEIAYRMNFIGREQLISLGRTLARSSYGQYLLSVADE